MNADTVRLFWIFFWLILINAFIFTMWAVMALSSRLSRDEKAQRDPAGREWYK